MALNDTQKGLLIVISGPSGTGKGTILNEVLKRNNKLNLSVSATTRLPRPNEVEGESYYFLSRKEFEKKIDQDMFLEYAEYCGNYYGTPLANVNLLLSQGKDVVLEIEVNGAQQVIHKFPKCISIFVTPPSLSDLKTRLINRGSEDSDTIQKRVLNAKRELKFSKDYKYIVVNDNLDNCVKDILKIIDVSRLTTDNMQFFINGVLNYEGTISK